MSRLCWASALLLGSACATSSGTAPQEMGVREHERAAVAEEDHARTSALIADYNQCSFAGRAPEAGSPCWTPAPDPAAEARRARERQLGLAAQHRAAAQALTEAEALHCRGIAAADRETSPFLHSEEISAVDALYGQAQSSRGANSRLEGATVTFRAVTGLTVQWLQRVIDCHTARNAALGYNDPALADCPLGLPGVSATVSAARGGFSVELRGDGDLAGQILRRAQALVIPAVARAR